MNIVTEKKCSKCGEVKPLTEFYKHQDKTRAECKECKRERSRVYQNENKTKVLEKIYRWAKANAEKVRAAKRKWRASNLEQARKASRENRRRSYAANPEKYREESRKSWRDNPEKSRESHRKWRENNYDKVLEYNRNRDAIRRGNGGTITAQEWQALKELYHSTCLRCKRKEPEIKLTLDHVLPLVLGGANAIDNAQPLCKSCNSIKSTKHIDYRPTVGRT